MRATLCLVISMLFLGSGIADDQAGQIRFAYKNRGEDFLRALYWLPETREEFRKRLPNIDQWVGFEKGRWEEIPAESQLLIIDELGSHWDKLDPKLLQTRWERIHQWELIAAQLGLMELYKNDVEVLLDWAFDDELLRPAFDWLLARRPKDFGLEHIGATPSTSEHVYIKYLLTKRLLDAEPAQRFACFARFYAQLSAEAALDEGARATE